MYFYMYEMNHSLTGDRTVDVLFVIDMITVYNKWVFFNELCEMYCLQNISL